MVGWTTRIILARLPDVVPGSLQLYPLHDFYNWTVTENEGFWTWFNVVTWSIQTRLTQSPGNMKIQVFVWLDTVRIEYVDIAFRELFMTLFLWIPHVLGRFNSILFPISTAPTYWNVRNVASLPGTTEQHPDHAMGSYRRHFSCSNLITIYKRSRI